MNRADFSTTTRRRRRRAPSRRQDHDDDHRRGLSRPADWFGVSCTDDGDLAVEQRRLCVFATVRSHVGDPIHRETFRRALSEYEPMAARGVRRSHVGVQLRSAPDAVWPSLPDTSGYVAAANLQCTTFPSPSVPRRNPCRNRTRHASIASALPYELHASVRVDPCERVGVSDTSRTAARKARRFPSTTLRRRLIRRAAMQSKRVCNCLMTIATTALTGSTVRSGAARRERISATLRRRHRGYARQRGCQPGDSRLLRRRQQRCLSDHDEYR